MTRATSSGDRRPRDEGCHARDAIETGGYEMLLIKQSAGRVLAQRPALRSSIKELVELAFWRKTL
ncbi:hypothetical protein NYY74_18190, partial [Acinetobacter baumannii]|nr:hypothetical protein [Acinetobacter baumannii]